MIFVLESWRGALPTLLIFVESEVHEFVGFCVFLSRNMCECNFFEILDLSPLPCTLPLADEPRAHCLNAPRSRRFYAR